MKVLFLGFDSILASSYKGCLCKWFFLWWCVLLYVLVWIVFFLFDPSSICVECDGHIYFCL